MWCLGLFILIVFSSKMGDFVQSQINSLYDTHPVVDKKDQSTSLTTKNDAKNRSSTEEAKIASGSSKISPLFLVFTFLFVGGVSSCLGGYYGTSYKKIRGQSFSNGR